MRTAGVPRWGPPPEHTTHHTRHQPPELISRQPTEEAGAELRNLADTHPHLRLRGAGPPTRQNERPDGLR